MRIAIFVFINKRRTLEKNPADILLYFPSDIHSGNGDLSLPFFQCVLFYKFGKNFRFFPNLNYYGNRSCPAIFYIAGCRKN